MNEEPLFEEALSRSAAERAPFLDQACAAQPELRAALEALLAAHEKSGNILDRPRAETVASGPGAVHADATLDRTPGPDIASSAANATADYGAMSEPGIVIAGRYTLQEKIGEGGMGEVWVAKQTEPVKRRVALKLIKTGMDSKGVLARFEQERQALAMMDHPNIAKVLDGGLTPTGQPFFVMELVNGLPLNKFCDEAKLTPRDRLELFVPICQAVQHAHQKGIVHRDLKPSNILVTLIDGKPVPKVIDFGVAKATAGKLTDASMDTQFGTVIGTLEYMSPEQTCFSGVDIDTRADIYSLGVILYELLTGLRPIDAKRLKTAALTEMIRIIREEEPSKPSTRLSTEESLPSMAALRQIEPRKLMALLRGELDWVVMKCLEKHRERRYETANGLARDIQRYLADETVEARPPAAGYRLRKFLHRNRGPVAAASVVLLALVLGIVGTTYGLIRAEQAWADEAKQRGIAESNEAKALGAAEAERMAKEREAEERAKAEKARDRTRQALDAMTSSVTGDSLTTQKEISAEQKKFLTEVLTYYQEFAGEKADDEPSRARTVDSAHRVGLIEYRLGRGPEAAAAWRLALAGYGKLTADFPAAPVYRSGLAGSHNNLGLMLAGLGKRPEAEEQYRKGLAILEKLYAEFPAVPKYGEFLANIQINLGNTLAELGKHPEAEELYRKALTIQQKLFADFPAAPQYRSGMASSHNNLGFLLAGLGKRPEAEEQYRTGLAILEKLTAEFPAVPKYRKSLADIQLNLGTLLAGLGKHLEAEQQYWKALAIWEKLVADFPAVPGYQEGLAKCHHDLGNTLAALGKRPEAEKQYRKGLAIQEKLFSQFPAVPQYRKDVGACHYELGQLLARLGRMPEAEEQYRTGLAIQENLVAEFPAVPEYRKFLARIHLGLVIPLAGLGKLPEAEEQNRKGLAIQEKLLAEFPTVPEYRHDHALGNNILGVTLAGQRKRPEAEEHFRKALAILEQLVTEFPGAPEYRTALGVTHNQLGVLLNGLGKRPEAEERFRKALAIHENLVGEFRVPMYREYLALSHCHLGELLREVGKRPEAEQEYRSALAIQEELVRQFPAVPGYRKDLSRSLQDLGILLTGLGNLPGAEEHFRKAMAIKEKLAAEFPAMAQYRVELGGNYSNFGILVGKTSQPGKSLEWFEKAIRTLTAVYEQDGRSVAARQGLRNSHWNRAMAYDRLRKFAEAIKDWDKAIELSGAEEIPELRRKLAQSHTGLGDVLAGLGKQPEAEEQFRKALAIQEKLVAEFPTVPEYRKDLALSRNNLGLLLKGVGNLPEAEEQFRKALAIKEKLVAEFPTVPQYRVDLGGSYCNFGNVVRNSGRPGESLEPYEKAIRTLTAVYEQDPRLDRARQFLGISHSGRAAAYDRLQKFTEAIKDWDRAIELSPEAEQPRRRAARATSCLRAGRVAEAVAEVAELTKNPSWPARSWYNFAGVFSIASGKIADKKQEYAERAMDLLRQAVKTGWSDSAHMAKDTDLDPLRGREDFKKLIEDLTKQSPAKPESKP